MWQPDDSLAFLFINSVNNRHPLYYIAANRYLLLPAIAPYTSIHCGTYIFEQCEWHLSNPRLVFDLELSYFDRQQK
jgi:hypothetical protein